jgi:multisubunit Na+/H+ antiporter MnhG subunit
MTTESSPLPPSTTASRTTGSGAILRDIYTWKHPMTSGGIFAAGVAVFLLLTYFQYNIVTLLTRAGQLLLVASGVYYSAVAKSSHPGGIDFSAYIQPMSVSIANCANQFARDLHRAYTWQDRGLSIKLMVGLQLLFWLANYFSFLVIFFTIFVITMTAPLIYSLQHKQIDAVVGKGKAQVHNGLQSINAKLPPAVREYSKKVGIELPAPSPVTAKKK